MKIRRLFNKIINDTKIIIFAVFILFVILIIFLNKKGNFFGYNDNNFKLQYEMLNDKVNDDGKKYPNVKLSDDNKFVYVNIDSVLDIFENKRDSVIYFGNADCIYCRSVVQVLNDTVLKTDLDKIFYLDIENEMDVSKLKDILGEEFINEDNEIEIPLVLFVANGKIVSYNVGTLFSHTDPFKKMDDSQIDGLSRIYLYGIRDVLKSIDSKKENME